MNLDVITAVLDDFATFWKNIGTFFKPISNFFNGEAPFGKLGENGVVGSVTNVFNPEGKNEDFDGEAVNSIFGSLDKGVKAFPEQTEGKVTE